MDNDVLFALVGKYRDYVIEAVKENEIRNSITGKNINILTSTVRDVKKLEDIFGFAEDLRKIDTYTIDAFNNNALARTTIELDADIITILPRDILDDSKLPLLLSLHNSNVYLTNQLFKSHMKTFSHFLISLNKIIRLISVIPFAISSLSAWWQMSLSPAVISALVSFFLYRYVPRIIFRYMPRTILLIGPKIVGFLSNRKIAQKMSN